MKRSFYLLMLALVCLLAAAAGYAQSDLRVVFTVSFPFTAGAAEMPAGSYMISTDMNGHGLVYPTRGGRSAAILLTRVSQFSPAKGRASVSFVERGGRYYLDTVNLLEGGVVNVGKVTR